MEKRPALGKGLSALIPDAPEPARSSPVDADIDRLAPNDFQPRAQRRRCAAAGAGAVDQGERHHSADRRAQGRRSVSDHRRRAPLARRQARRPAARAGRRARRRARAGAIAARDGADRKHPARGSEPDRRGARLSPPRRRISPEAGRHRHRRRQGPRVGRELRPAAQAARTKSAPRSRRAACRWATRARCCR